MSLSPKFQLNISYGGWVIEFFLLAWGVNGYCARVVVESSRLGWWIIMLPRTAVHLAKLSRSLSYVWGWAILCQCLCLHLFFNLLISWWFWFQNKDIPTVWVYCQNFFKNMKDLDILYSFPVFFIAHTWAHQRLFD